MKKFRGFSLFEIMLGVVITSMLAVAVLKYSNHQSQVSADQIYGQNLYTFGQGVYAYVAANAATLPITNTLAISGGAGNNPQVGTGMTITAGTVPTCPTCNRQLVIYGTQWLTSQYAGTNQTTKVPYLSNTFTAFPSMPNMILAFPWPTGQPDLPASGNYGIDTYIFYTSGNTSIQPVVMIAAGALFQKTGSGSSITYTLLPDLTADAINHANTLYTPTLGTSLFNYSYPYAAGGAGSWVTGTVTIGSPATGSNYLMTAGSDNGGNSMFGALSFNPTAPGTASINFPSSGGAINFAGTTGGTISGVKTLTMQDPSAGTGNIVFNGYGAIQKLYTLSFKDGTGGSTTAINGINHINFAGQTNDSLGGMATINFPVGGAGTGVITNVTEMDFNPTNNVSPFRGMTVTTFGKVNGTGVTNPNPSIAVYNASGQYRSLCFLTQATQTGAAMTNWGCNVYNNAGFWQLVNNGPSASTCGVYCLEWD